MKTTIRPGLDKKPDLRIVIERATPWLEKAIGESADGVEASWGLATDDRGRDEIELTLKDWTGEMSSRYAPAEVASEREAYWRFLRQWGDLLQQDVRRRVKQLRSEAAQAGTE